MSIARSTLLEIQMLAQLQDRRHRVVQHLRAEVRGGVAEMHLAVAHRNRAGQAGRQLQLEIRQPLAAERPAEADHRRLADVGLACDVDDRIVDDRTRMIEREIGDAAFGRRQRIAHLANPLEHRRRTAARAVRQLLRENRRDAEERRIFRRNHVGRHAPTDTASKRPFASKRSRNGDRGRTRRASARRRRRCRCRRARRASPRYCRQTCRECRRSN